VKTYRYAHRGVLPEVLFLGFFPRIRYFKWKSLFLAGKKRQLGKANSPLTTHEVKSIFLIVVSFCSLVNQPT
jgi:hypothetical protein